MNYLRRDNTTITTNRKCLLSPKVAFNSISESLSDNKTPKNIVENQNLLILEALNHFISKFGCVHF